MKKEQKQLNYAVVAKAHTPMYLMHKWWARKPHNVVAEYIKNYTKKGDIVLDPFCGSGVTAIESLKLGRKAVAIDLDPMATFITKMTAIPVDIEKIKETFEEIEKNIESKIKELYKTKCGGCGNQAEIICTHHENSAPIKIYYYCLNCNEKFNKTPDKDDLELINKIGKMKVPYWYPKTRLAYNGEGFMKREKADSIPELFTKRNLISLSILFNQIEKIKDNKIKEIFRFAFTSMVHLASKLTPVRPTRPMSSFWAIQSFWVPPIFMESNVLMLFNSVINGRQGIVVGKEDSNSQILKYKEADDFDDLRKEANVLIRNNDALELSKIIPKNSIDYVFTDPPYGGAVQYFELSTLWASWLNMDLNYQDEVTINKQQNKDFEYYHKMLRKTFKEIYKVLKPGKYLTVTFHSTDIKVWNSIIKAVVMVGFDLEKIVYQPPARPSAKGLLQPYGSAVGDYYIRFVKPTRGVLRTEKEIDLKTYELEVVDAAKTIIGERGEPTMYQHILNGIMVELKGGRNVPIGAKNVEQVLKEHVGKEFELIDILNEEGKKVGKKWWLKNADISHFSRPTLSDRVERTIVSILDKNPKVSFDDIVQRVFIDHPNALTPETEKIREVLQQYAERTDGMWRLKPDVKISISQHSKMIYLLALIGKKLGFDIWIGTNEQGDSYNNKKLSTFVTVREPTWRFINNLDWDRINMIDVIWHEQGRIAFEFEVENTTAITEAISRGSNIPHNKLGRVIVIPKERENFLFKKIRDPMINENIEKYGWKFLFYDDVNKLFNRKNLTTADIKKLFRSLKEERENQSSIRMYL